MEIVADLWNPTELRLVTSPTGNVTRSFFDLNPVHLGNLTLFGSGSSKNIKSKGLTPYGLLTACLKLA
jgi:hypothetical protein